MRTLGAATLYGSALGRQEQVWTSARLQAAVAHRHRIGIAIFHDGNPGHLWRGEIASKFGEVLVAIGAVIWLAAQYQSPFVVAVALICLGLPYVVAGPFGARLENSSRPGTPLRWLGNLRVLLVLGLIGLFFHTIVPAVYVLLFLLSFIGRLHDAARIAATRVCLAPGEPEHVANDVYVGGALASVLGPILVTLFFVLAGERVLAVYIVAAIAFLVSANSEGLLDALPPGRRAFLLATPEAQYPDGDIPALAYPGDQADQLDDEEWREETLPAWYQQGPKSAGQALGELRSGFGLVGSSPRARLALLGISFLSVAGGAFSALFVFYVIGELGLPSFYLGPLAAAEGVGLVLGGQALGSSATAGKGWQGRLWLGLAGTGLLFAALSVVPILLIDIILALCVGYLAALAVSGARRALYVDFDPVEQRAIAAGENWVSALGVVTGVILVGLFLQATEPVLSSVAAFPKALPGLPVNELLFVLGIGLIVSAFLVVALGMGGRNRGRSFKPGAPAGRVPASGLRVSDEDDTGWDDAGHGGWDGPISDDVDEYESNW
jgi:MFS family permease